MLVNCGIYGNVRVEYTSWPTDIHASFEKNESDECYFIWWQYNYKVSLALYFMHAFLIAHCSLHAVHSFFSISLHFLHSQFTSVIRSFIGSGFWVYFSWNIQYCWFMHAHEFTDVRSSIYTNWNEMSEAEAIWYWNDNSNNEDDRHANIYMNYK